MIEVTTAEAPPKRGRPRKHPETPPETVEKTPATVEFSEQSEPESTKSETAIPDWPLIAPKVKAQELFDYWNALTPEQQKFGTVYVYRLHPKMQLQPWRGQMVNENCEKFQAEDGPLSQDVIFKRRRLGIYLLRLSKLRSHGQVTQAELEIRGEWTADNMPILDIDKLDQSHPSNAEYIRILKVRGILKPEEKESPEGAEEMAATSVLGEIASKAFEKMGNQPQQQNNNGGGSDLAGVVAPIIGLLDKQINQNRPPEQQGTVLDMVRALNDISKANAPAPVDLSPFMKLQEQNNALMERIMQKDVQRAEADATKAREEFAALQASLPKPKTLDEQFDDLERAAARYKRLRGEDEEEEPARGKKAENPNAGFFGNLPGIVGLWDKLNETLRLSANLLYNHKLNGSGSAPLNPDTNTVSTTPAAPPAAQAPQEENPYVAQMQEIDRQLSKITPFLLKHLRQGKTGAQFAAFIVDADSQEALDQIRMIQVQVQLPDQSVQTIAGKQALLALIQQYPPIWDAEIAPGVPLKNAPQKFVTFLDEFLAYQPVRVN